MTAALGDGTETWPRFLRAGAQRQSRPRDPTRIWPEVLTVLLPLASAYYLGYLFRTINALIADDLVTEFALSPADLGLLTAVLFLAFSATQLPLGGWLDRFGPRRVQAALLSVAALGAALFAGAHGFASLLLGRAFIGVGIAGALMAGLKGIVLWFPVERATLAIGCIIMIGGLGAITATAPAEAVLSAIGWRNGFLILALLTAACALLILLVVPERSDEEDHAPLDYGIGIITILGDRRFWRVAPLSAMCVGSAWALQGLWAGPWLADVEGLARHDVVLHLALIAAALSASALLLGGGADRLRRRGVPLSTSLAIASAVALFAQLALVLRWPVPTWLPWIPVAGIGTATVLSYAIVTELFPRSVSGRATGALNLLHVGMAAALQIAFGLVVGQWPAESGHHPAVAYQTALGVILVLEAVALCWFVRPEPRAMAPVLGRHPIHAVARSLDLMPDAATPYHLARHAWITRQERAQRQARAWRSVAFASFTVLTVLSGALTAVLSKGVLSGSPGGQRGMAELEMWDTRPAVLAAVPRAHDHVALLEKLRHE